MAATAAVLPRMMRITMVMTIPLKLQEQVKIADTIMMVQKQNGL